jgi:hypothetical protein
MDGNGYRGWVFKALCFNSSDLASKDVSESVLPRIGRSHGVEVVGECLVEMVGIVAIWISLLDYSADHTRAILKRLQ